MGYTEETKGEDIYFIPQGDHTHTLIWCHGLGDTGKEIIVVTFYL